MAAIDYRQGQVCKEYGYSSSLHRFLFNNMCINIIVVYRGQITKFERMHHDSTHNSQLTLNL